MLRGLHQMTWSIGWHIEEDGQLCGHFEYAVLTMRTCRVDEITGNPVSISLIFPDPTWLPREVTCMSCEADMPTPAVPWDHPVPASTSTS